MVNGTILFHRNKSDNNLSHLFLYNPLDMERYNILLEGNSSGTVTDAQCVELAALRQEADRFMLRKAQVSVLLRWRGHSVPTP